MPGMEHCNIKLQRWLLWHPILLYAFSSHPLVPPKVHLVIKKYSQVLPTIKCLFQYADVCRGMRIILKGLKGFSRFQYKLKPV
jgi:hypothetical protein